MARHDSLRPSEDEEYERRTQKAKSSGDVQNRRSPLSGSHLQTAGIRPSFDPWVPEEFRPRAIFPETNTVIVLGLPVSLPVLETAPSIHYHELYRTINTLLDMRGLPAC